MTACTEVLEPNVDYGSNTYTNDYSALVKAVNDLQKSLEDRFDALNSLLKAGLLDLKLSIDETTGKIEVLEATTKSGLSNIDTSLLEGFTAIADSIDSNGDKVVTAMNENGDIIKVALNTQGKAISTTIANMQNNAEAEDVLETMLEAQIAQKQTVETLTGDDKTNAEKIIQKLDEMLNEQGIYVAINKTTNKPEIYVTMEAWVKMKETNKEVLAKCVDELEVEVDSHLYNAEGKETATVNVEAVKDETATTDNEEGTTGADLQALNLQAYPDVTGSEEILLYKLYKVPSITLEWSCSVSNILNNNTTDQEAVEHDNRVKAYMITDASGNHGEKDVTVFSVSSSYNQTSEEIWYYTYTYSYQFSGIKATLVKDGKVKLNEDGTKALVKVELFTKNQEDKYKGMTIDD